MPVYVPQDTRWGDLGKGLGAIAAGALTAYDQRQTAEGVAQIMADPTVAEKDRPIQALKKYGARGYDIYQNMLKSQVLSAQLTDVLAKSKLTDIQTKLLEPKVGTAPAMAQAELKEKELAPALTAAKIGEAQATTGVEQARTGLIGAQEMNVRAEAPGTAAKSELEVYKARAYKNMLDQQSELLASGSTTLDKMLDDMGVTDPNKRAIAKNAYTAEKDPTKAQSAFVKSVETMTSAERSAQARANIEEPPPADIRTRTENSAQAATASQSFVDAFRRDPSASGLMSGASITAWLEHRGIPTGDLNQIQMRVAQLNSAAKAATSSGGFYSEGRFALAKDVTAGTSETPLYAVEALKETADQNVAQLNADKSSLPTRYKKDAIDNTLSQWQKIKDVTDTFQSSVFKDAKGNQRTIVYFDGKQVDPKTFKTLVENSDTKYTVGKGTVTGRELFTAAAQSQLPPDEVLKYWQQQATQAR